MPSLGGGSPKSPRKGAMHGQRRILYVGLLAVLGACLVMGGVQVAVKGVSVPEIRLRSQEAAAGAAPLLEPTTGQDSAGRGLRQGSSGGSASAGSSGSAGMSMYEGPGIRDLLPELDGRAVGALLPGVRGWTKKAALTNRHEWAAGLADARVTTFLDWRAKRSERRAQGAPLQRTLSCGGADEPGLAFPGCHIMINDRYRFIYIRTPKAGSTSVVDALGQCGNNRTRGGREQHPSCMRLITDVDPAIWNDYFVFGFVRNPWRRAYSLYKYLQSDSTMSWPHIVDGVIKSPQCKSTWGDFCHSPWEEAERLHRAGCFFRSRPYLYYHFNSQHRCFRTAEGEWATDFIGGLDGHVNEDWRTILTEINRRRLPEFPEIPLEDLEETNVKPNNVKDPFGGDNAHCLDAVTNWFACDAEAFGFWPTNSSTSAAPAGSLDASEGEAAVRRAGNRRHLLAA